MIWLSLVTFVLMPLTVAELSHCCPWIADKLVVFASTKVPASAREEQLAQWQGDIDTVPGQLLKVLKATSILLRSPAAGRAIASAIQRDSRPVHTTEPKPSRARSLNSYNDRLRLQQIGVAIDQQLTPLEKMVFLAVRVDRMSCDTLGQQFSPPLSAQKVQNIVAGSVVKIHNSLRDLESDTE